MPGIGVPLCFFNPVKQNLHPFLLEWRPDGPYDIGIFSGSYLELDSAGNIYLIAWPRDRKQNLQLITLNYDGETLDETVLEDMSRSRFLFRVTGSGTKFLFDGLDCVQLDSNIGEQRVHHFLTHPFSDLILTGNSDADKAGRGELELFAGPPVMPGNGTTIVIKRPDPYGDIQGVTTAIDSRGRIFILSMSQESRMEVYDSEGVFLGLVPDCPKQVPGSFGDSFLTDYEGNLYQMEVVPRWRRDTTEAFVNIWKWDSLN